MTIEPYYQDEYATIYNADAMEVIGELDDVSFVFADPPFNVGIRYGEYNDSIDEQDYDKWQARWITAGFEALSDDGTFYLMTITKHLPVVFAEMSRHGTFISQVVWKNVAAVGSKRYYWRQYQPIVAYGKTNDYYFDTYALTRDSGFRRWGGYSTAHKGQMGDIWDDIPFIYAGSIHHKEAIMEAGSNSKAHPAQMPEALAIRMLSFSYPHHGIAVDLFMGSGTLLRAAKDLCIPAVGFDISERYCELAANRLRQPKIQTPLPARVDGEQGAFNL